MITHTTATREEWLGARLQLLEVEKELTRRSDEVARKRQELPWVRIDTAYRFDTETGSASLADLFRGNSQLIIYHFMFGPDFKAGCPSCSAIADGFDGFAVHLRNHDVMFSAVSRAPLPKLQAYKKRLGWNFPWASSHSSDFNFDFNVAVTEEQQAQGGRQYNFAPFPPIRSSSDVPAGVTEFATSAGTDGRTFMRELPGMSAFAIQDGAVHHTYSAYARGLDGLWSMYQWLDRAPLGRNEHGLWWKRHDEYGTT